MPNLGITHQWPTLIKTNIDSEYAEVQNWILFKQLSAIHKPRHLKGIWGLDQNEFSELNLPFDPCPKSFDKVHIFWEGHKISRNLHLFLTGTSNLLVINVGSDTFGNPIFQKGLQN